jgi:hypothetical protein
VEPIFVAGCGRSGTTLFASLLARRYGLVMTPESQFLVRTLAETGGLTPRAASSLRLRLWELDDAGSILAAASPNGPAAAMRALVVRYAERSGQGPAKHWVDHTPSNISYVDTLLALFPEARVVHLVRDPRAVAASVVPLDWGPASPRAAAQWWLRRLAAGLAAEAAHPDRVLRLRYEDLVDDVDGVLEEFGNRCGLGPADLSPADAPGLPRYTARQHELVGRPVDPSRANAWRGDLSSHDIAIVEGEVGDCLAHLGYVTVGPRPAPAFRPTAAERAGTTLRQAGQRLRREVRRRSALRGL